MRELGLEVKLHPKIKAEKSIICRKVESIVGEKTKEEIKSEIMRCNEGLKVEEVVKFGYYTLMYLKYNSKPCKMLKELKNKAYYASTPRLLTIKSRQKNTQTSEFVSTVTS